jgi:endonuclease/exonuclease/phosphatase family metal-dependent hydrolase
MESRKHHPSAPTVTACAGAGADTLADMTGLRILTANLWAHNSDPAGFERVLRDVDPDLVALQELQVGNAAVVAARFAHHGLAPHIDTLGTGVASRFPAEISPLPMTYRSGWWLRLDPESCPRLARPFELVNVHLANPVGWPWFRSVKNRRYQVDALLTHVAAEPIPRVVVGDFNATPSWPAYRRIAQQFLDGAVATGTPQRTWRFQGRTPPLLRIDHAFGSDVRFLTTDVVEIPGADHLGLVIDIEV